MFNAQSLVKVETDFLGLKMYRFFGRRPSNTHKHPGLSFPGYLIVVGHPLAFKVVNDATCGLGVYRPARSMKYLRDYQTNRLTNLDQVTHISLRHKGVYYNSSKKKHSWTLSGNALALDDSSHSVFGNYFHRSSETLH